MKYAKRISFGNTAFYLKKKHKIATPEKSTSSDEKEWNCESFYARIKTKTVLESLKDSLQTHVAFFLFFFVFY